MDPLFSKKLLTEKRSEFNLESHLAFLEYAKAFDSVTRDKLFEKLQTKIFPICYKKKCSRNVTLKQNKSKDN
jgi:hypothetical protein